MKMIAMKRNTTAQTAPIVSGISFLCTLLKSFPFNPAFMNAGPSQRIMAYVAEKAMPLKASDATSGSPSPWKVFATTPTQPMKRESRLSCSVTDSSEDVMAAVSSPSSAASILRKNWRRGPCRSSRQVIFGGNQSRAMIAERGILSLAGARTALQSAASRTTLADPQSIS